MASIWCKSIFSILFLFVLLLSYSLAAQEGKASDKNSEMNDFAEFEREDDDDVDDSYEDEIENQPAERNKAEEFDDNEADIETGTFHFKTVISLIQNVFFLQNAQILIFYKGNHRVMLS